MRAIGVRPLSLAGFVLSWTAASAQIDVPVGESIREGNAAATKERQETTRTELRVERRSIPYEVVYEVSRTVGPGRVVKRSDGKPGEIRRTFEVRIRDGKVIGRELVKTETIPAVPARFAMGRTGFPTSRGAFRRNRVLTMEATAYDPSAGRGRHATFRTKTGIRAEFGVVAVDPRVIPLGTKLFIEGYGLALAADIGGAIKGMRIDLCVPTRAEAMRFGRRQVRVHILR